MNLNDTTAEDDLGTIQERARQMRYIRTPKTSLRCTAACVTAAVLLAAHAGYSVSIPNIDLRRWEEDGRDDSGKKITTRHGIDWMASLSFEGPDGESIGFDQPLHDPGFSVLKGMVLIAGPFTAARIMHTHPDRIIWADAVELQARMVKLVDDPWPKATKFDRWLWRLQRDVRKLANYDPFVQTVAHVADRLHAHYIYDGKRAPLEILDTYVRLKRTFPLPIQALEPADFWTTKQRRKGPPGIRRGQRPG